MHSPTSCSTQYHSWHDPFVMQLQKYADFGAATPSTHLQSQQCLIFQAITSNPACLVDGNVILITWYIAEQIYPNICDTAA